MAILFILACSKIPVSSTVVMIGSSFHWFHASRVQNTPKQSDVMQIASHSILCYKIQSILAFLNDDIRKVLTKTNSTRSLLLL